MRDNRTPKALPPLLGHYADALNALRDTDPQAFSHLAPLCLELESVDTLAQQALRDHPDSEAAQRFEQLRDAHRQLPEILSSSERAHVDRQIIGPWPLPTANRDPRLDHLSVIVGAWPPNPGRGASAGKTCPHCGKAI